MVGVESEISATSDSNQDSLWGACHNHHTRLRKLCQELERETAQTLSRTHPPVPVLRLDRECSVWVLCASVLSHAARACRSRSYMGAACRRRRPIMSVFE